jgi:periplasmic protein TonB
MRLWVQEVELMRTMGAEGSEPDGLTSPKAAAGEGPFHGNVVVFTGRPTERAGGRAPAPELQAGERSCEPVSDVRSAWLHCVLLFVSVAAHGGLFAAFMRAPEPQSSIGIPAISVEIVFGAESAAGVARTPSPVETQAAPTPKEEPKAEPQEPQSEPVRAPEPAEVAPTEAIMAPEKPVEGRQELPQQKPERIVERDPVHEPSPKETEPAPSRPSGVGRGRSAADANYPGLVAAHLARHKQFPAAARRLGHRGDATVTFALDENGRVTSVKLVRGTGVASLDEEAQAMVRRASPFPPPPSRHPISFTVPISFNLR